MGLARIGSDNQQIIVCTLKEMSQSELGLPLHSLIIPAKNLHPLEIEYLNHYTGTIKINL